MATDNAHRTAPECAEVDCERGRRLGCRVFCCRLLVRLAPEEQEPNPEGLAAKGFVDKDPDGYCVHFDRERGICRIWERRPKICRAYDCNQDPLLQVALRYEFKNLADLVRKAARAFVPREQYRQIPYRRIAPPAPDTTVNGDTHNRISAS